jgi:subtilisin family serine protease
MKNLLLIFISAIIFVSENNAQTDLKVLTKENISYLSNTVILKLKNKSLTADEIRNILPAELSNSLKITSIKKVFPSLKNKSGSLNRIFVLEYNSSFDPFFLSSKLKGIEEIEYAEPKFIRFPLYVPNDPSYGVQYALPKIEAPLAWDITKGDTSVVIAIIDTGVDWDHPDLSGNIWINWNEIESNGIDDDNNGYTDDYRGWDFGGFTGVPDNNPVEDQADHGTHVAGIASASTDNGIGIASIGFNSKIMAVKTCQNNFRNQFGQPFILFGYEGIVYAVDNGAQIINCSWGGGGFSLFEEEVIDYAVSNGSLVVAAAGNDNSPFPFYPSGYVNVLSVASTNSSDVKSSFSNYGSTIDVSAPGSAIQSTWFNNVYTSISGTSMSSPLAAGLAALVKSYFPLYTPLQVGEQIRVNSDDISPLNPSFGDLLGKGRINAFKSLSNLNSISVRAIEVNFSDSAPGGNGDGIFQGGETISLRIKFINFLNSTENLAINLESRNSYSTVSNGFFNAGAIASQDSFDNFTAPFQFTLTNSLPQNSDLKFKLLFSDAGYNDFQLIETTGNQTYATQSGNDVSLTITSKGTLGFNDYPGNLQGKGFVYLNGTNLLFEGALILGTSPTKISDGARNSSGNAQNSDFNIVQPFKLKIPGYVADQEGSNIFNDDGAGGNKIGITAKLGSYSYAGIPDKNYIILIYNLSNNSGSPITGLYAGLFFDWDLIEGSGTNDIASFDSTGNLAYVYNSTGVSDTWIGAALLSSADYNFWAIKNDGGDNGFQIYDGFSDQEKWQALSSDTGKSTSGPGDISFVISGGPFNLQPNDSVNVAFMIACGINKNDLITAAANARSKYLTLTDVHPGVSEIPENFNLYQNFPNPFNPDTKIIFEIPSHSVKDGVRVKLKIYDVLGKEIITLVDENKSSGRYEINFNAADLPSGVYFYKLSAGVYSSVKKMMLIK